MFSVGKDATQKNEDSMLIRVQCQRVKTLIDKDD